MALVTGQLRGLEINFAEEFVVTIWLPQFTDSVTITHYLYWFCSNISDEKEFSTCYTTITNLYLRLWSDKIDAW